MAIYTPNALWRPWFKSRADMTGMEVKRTWHAHGDIISDHRIAVFLMQIAKVKV